MGSPCTNGKPVYDNDRRSRCNDENSSVRIPHCSDTNTALQSFHFTSVLSLIMHETIAGYKTVNARCKWKGCEMVDGNLFLIFATFELRLFLRPTYPFLPFFLSRYKNNFSYTRITKFSNIHLKRICLSQKNDIPSINKSPFCSSRIKAITDTIFSPLLDRFLFAYR